MTEFQSIGCIRQIEADLANVTDELIRQCDSSLDPAEASETVLLETTPDTLRRLWTLSHGYLRAAQLAGHAERFDVTDEAEKKLLNMSGARLLAMAEICRDIYWTELRDVAKDAGGWSGTNVGIRKGFKLVVSSDQSPSVSMETIPIPMSLLSGIAKKILGKMQEQPEDEAEAPPKGKPS